MKSAFTKLYNCLKPGGCLLFRDYGRYDEAQLRFTNKSRLGENFYVRQDGTCVYYFEDSELRALLCGAETQTPAAETAADVCSVFASLQSPVIRSEEDCKGIGFECQECYYIKRQYANRAQKTARYRVWVHGKFRKPLK
jgi:SAM-dependent methyltransferase